MLVNLESPVITVVDGHVAGGGMGLVCASDLVIASTSLRLHHCRRPWYGATLPCSRPPIGAVTLLPLPLCSPGRGQRGVLSGC